MNSYNERCTVGKDKFVTGGERSFLRPKEAWRYLGIGRSSFYAIQNPRCAQYDESFPSAYQIAKRTRVWSFAELSDWVRQRGVKVSEGGAQ